MNTRAAALALLVLAAAFAGCRGTPSKAAGPARMPVDTGVVDAEIAARYRHAEPEIREYVRWTAANFGRSGLWLTEDAFTDLSPGEREEKVQYVLSVLQGDYGRHQCRSLAEAGSLRDPRLVQPLLKVAAYHRDDRDYDCRPKWMAVAALARQESEDAVPVLVSLVDHGNANTRKWARAALARITGRDLKEDKRAWADWWQAEGHAPIPEELLAPWKPAANPT